MNARRALSTAFTLAFFSSPALGAETTRCMPKKDKLYRVAEALPPQALKTRSGAVLRLIGLDLPDPVRHGDNADIAALSKRARDALVGLVGRDVRISREKGSKPDRWGRIPAQVFAISTGGSGAKSNSEWMQRRLLRLGLARLRPAPGETHCVKDLFKDEGYARANRLGLWRLPEFRHQDAEDETLLTRVGRFGAVTGTIISVGKTKRRVYLNFGRHWSTDFTASMTGKVYRSLAAAGVTEKRLKGARVTIRGWIKSRRGPYIEITVPEQVEIAGAIATGTRSQDRKAGSKDP